MKRILMIATGGTIASEQTACALRPMLSAEQILKYISMPGWENTIDTIELFNLDSTNMRPQNWLEIARCVEDHYALYDGFVVTHGTDTLAYTASALSYLIQRAKKPVVLTGAQKSISTQDTDARRNLADAFFYAADARSHGVCVVFDGRVIAGTRARKMRTKSRNAFSSVDYPEIAAVRDGKILRYFYQPEYAQTPVFSHALNDRIFVLKLFPGIDARILDDLLPRVDALVIESFGVGGIPTYAGAADFLKPLTHFCAEEKTVVIATQVPFEGSDLGVYQVGFQIKERFDVIEAYNMTLEAAVTKLMWILAKTRDPQTVRTLFYTPVANDLLV